MATFVQNGPYQLTHVAGLLDPLAGVGSMALCGVKVIEMAGLAPAPFCGMILADFGASVIRVDKTNQPPLDTLSRNKKSLAVNLKHQDGVDIVKQLCTNADVLIEGYRPGVMEKMGLGPEVLQSLNSKLIYARLTGYGQSGCLASKAGHDINYLAISGVLSMLGRSGEAPYAPINLLGDFAGGSFSCVIGILAALFERHKSNKGQVIDSAMVDGVAYLGSFLRSTQKLGFWTGHRGENLLDGGAPFYNSYKTADGKYMSVGAIEPQFYNALLQGLGLTGHKLPQQMDLSEWKNLKTIFAEIFLTKTREEWTNIFSSLDACVEPVLEMDEACEHPHNKHRQVFFHHSEGTEALPAPKLERTRAYPGSLCRPEVGQSTVDILKDLNYSDKRIHYLREKGIVHQSLSTSKL